MTGTQINIPKDKIEKFCRRWKIKELALFGSVLREDFRPDSDVDVLVTFEPDGGIEDFQEAARQQYHKTFKKVKGWKIALGIVIGVKLLILLLRAIL